MVEPCDYSEIFKDTQAVSSSFAELKAVCDHTVYCYRFNVDKVKKLSKLVENLQVIKNTINDNLEKIQNSFDDIETMALIYLHNSKKVQDELIRISELNEIDMSKMKISDNKVRLDQGLIFH